MDEDTFANRCAKTYLMSFCKTAGVMSAIVIFAALLPKNNNVPVVTTPTP